MLTRTQSWSVVLFVVAMLALASSQAFALTVEIVKPETDPYESSNNNPIEFQAVAYDEAQEDVSDQVTWLWEFGDDESSDENPVLHAYEDPGYYLVEVTAQLGDQQAEDETHIQITEAHGCFIVVAPPEMTSSGKACDQPVVMVLCKMPCDDAYYCWMWVKPPGEDWQQHCGGQHNNVIQWNGEDHKLYGLADWHSCAMYNYNVGTCSWKAYVNNPHWGWAWVGPTEPLGIHNTVIDTDDDCAADGILLYDPGDDDQDEVTISWSLSHLAYHNYASNDPPFNIRVKIYALGSSSATFTYDMADELLSNYQDSVSWKGWQGQYNDWDEEMSLPEEAGNAPKGIYCYRVWAVHTGVLWNDTFDEIETFFGQDCKDTDKSWRLGTAVTGFYYFSKDVQAGKLKGIVKYHLNRAAGEGSVALEFYGPNLGQLGELTDQPHEAGTHWSDVYELTGVEFDDNDNPVGPIYCVLHATENADDGELNRDAQPKPALQRGTTTLEELLNLTAEETLFDSPLAEHEEEDPGAYVHYNIDNDDDSDNTVGAPKHPGWDLPQQDQPVTGENDPLLAAGSFDGTIHWGKAALVRTNDHIRVWTNQTKGQDNKLLVDPADTEKVWDLSNADQYDDFHATRTSLYVEGTDQNAEADLKLQFRRSNDTLIGEDVVHYTAIAADCGKQPTTTYAPAYGDSQRGFFETAFPNLERCEWSITADPTTAYNCIAFTVNELTVWWTSDWTHRMEYPNEKFIDREYGNDDGNMTLTELDTFYDAKGYQLLPAGTPENADVMYYSGYHGAEKRSCPCGDAQWIMYESKCGGADRIEHIYDQLDNSTVGYGTRIRYYEAK